MMVSMTPDYAARLSAVRDGLRDRDLDGLVVFSPANRRYLTGYTAADTGIGESAGMVLVTAEALELLVGPLYIEHARHESRTASVVELTGRSTPALCVHLQAHQLGRIGFERQYTLYSVYEDLAMCLGDAVQLQPVQGMVEDLRERKDSAEQALMREAARIADAAYTAVVSELRPGLSERQIARQLDEHMIQLGATGPSFPTIVAIGGNAARPHHEPGDAQLEPGSPVIIDMGARFGGYCSDMTRSFSFGVSTAEYIERYGQVQAAFDAAVNGLHAGMSGRDADALARESLDSYGLAEYFTHSLGHGVGLDVHERPRLSRDSEDVLESAMVVTIEPGIYISGWGGIRIEDSVLLTPDGLEVLNHADKSPEV